MLSKVTKIPVATSVMFHFYLMLFFIVIIELARSQKEFSVLTSSVSRAPKASKYSIIKAYKGRWSLVRPATLK